MNDIIVDDHLTLGVVEPVQPAGILGKRAFPRNRHGKKKSIETGIIETLAEIAPGRNNDAFLALGNCGETRGNVAASLLALSAARSTWDRIRVSRWLSSQVLASDRTLAKVRGASRCAPNRRDAKTISQRNEAILKQKAALSSLPRTIGWQPCNSFSN